MNWRQVELLRCVVECGSFARAAQRAGVSQPAVSQALQRLAQDVGEPLFERQGRRQVPTATALALAQAMRSVTQGWQTRAEGRALQVPHAGRQRTLRLGLAPAAGLLYGGALANALLTAHPRLRVEMTTDSAPAMLSALQCGELDAVLAPRPRGMDDAAFHTRRLYLSQPSIYCRQGHALAGATSLRHIARAQWVVAGQAGTPSGMLEEAFRVRRWAPPHIAMQCADYAQLVALVAGSDLLGVLPHPHLLTLAGAQQLVPIPVDESLPHYEVCVFWPRHQRFQRAKGAAVDACLNTVLNTLLATLDPPK